MSVNKIKLKTEGFGNEPFFNIPINLNSVGVNNADAIETEFIQKELDKLIPEVDDNEIVRYSYKQFNNLDIDSISININLAKNGINQVTHLSDVGLTYDDLKYKRKRFKHSFIKIEIFDSPNIKTQKKIGEYTIFLNMLKEWFTSITTIQFPEPILGNLLEPSQCRLRFKSFDPIKFLNNYNEGYNIYVGRKYAGATYELSNFVYLRFSFNNAVTGISHKLGKTPTAKPINELINDIHIKTKFYIDGSGTYRYEFTENITNGANTSLQLYECIAI